MTNGAFTNGRLGNGAARDTAPHALVKVLIVDDMEDARWALSKLIERAGFTPLVAVDGAQALACIQQEAPDVMLLDVGLPDMDGFEVLARAKAHDKTLTVIMLTANGRMHDAVRAIRAGACDYLTKPFNNEDVVLTVRRTLEEKLLRGSSRQSLPQPSEQASNLLNCMGTGVAIQRIQLEVERVALTNFSVLVTGESGTGKELVSQAIHAQSLRAAKPFVAVDCGAISEALIESELFGHEKGAFTGAHQAKAGAFELASGGTIFLDEIGNLPLAMQGKLLRILETRRIHRLGSTKEQRVDFRVVAATNADLREMVKKQTFRGDLYHRLAEYTIGLPPLRERKEDFAFLVNRILIQASQELDKPVPSLSASAWAFILEYDWPGNARELRNQLRRALLLCDVPDGVIVRESLGGRVECSSLSPAPARDQAAANCSDSHCTRACPLRDSAALFAAGVGPPLKELTGQMVEQMEREVLRLVLSMTNGNKAQAARLLHIDYKTMHSKVKAYEISTLQFMKDPCAPNRP